MRWENFQPPRNIATEEFIKEYGVNFYLQHHRKYLKEEGITPYLVRVLPHEEWSDLEFVDKKQMFYFFKEKDEIQRIYNIAVEKKDDEERDEILENYKCIDVFPNTPHPEQGWLCHSNNNDTIG